MAFLLSAVWAAEHRTKSGPLKFLFLLEPWRFLKDITNFYRWFTTGWTDHPPTATLCLVFKAGLWRMKHYTITLTGLDNLFQLKSSMGSPKNQDTQAKLWRKTTQPPTRRGSCHLVKATLETIAS